MTVKTVQTEDCSMDYGVFGKGDRPLVILPGLSVQSVLAAASAVEKAYAKLREDFTVYLFDRRKELPPVYPLEQMAADTAAAMDALGLFDVCLFGASQGGMMALQLTLDRPDLVGKLALGSTASRVDRTSFPAIGEWTALAKARDGEGLYLAFGEKVYPPAMFERYRRAFAMLGRSVKEDDLDRFVILANAASDGFDVTARLSEIRCPVLLLGARDDAVLGAAATEEMIRAFDGRKDVEAVWYDGYGHAAYDLAPDYKEQLRRFFTADNNERT